MNESAAVAEFVNELGATMAVSVNRSSSYTATRRYVAQAMANDIGDTFDCDGLRYPIIDYEFPTYQKRSVAAKLVIVFDRPSPQSAGHRTFLRRALAAQGMDPTSIANLWAFPFGLPHPPLETHVQEYRAATIEAIRASGAQYVCLLGGTCVKLWRRELQVGQVMGRMGVMDSTWFTYVMPNPIVPLSDPLLMSGYREGIRTLVDIVTNDSGMDEFGVMCIEKGCKEDMSTNSSVFVYDPDGLPWCKTHWRKGFKRRLEHKARQSTIINTSNQGELL